jgi:CheY-like chemotaxis protein
MADFSILVVEDEFPLRQTVVAYLQDEGYRVAHTGSGRAALRALQQEPPDLILLDMHLPDADGWEVARYIRAHGLSTRLIVMTAAASARTIAQELRADAYVAKPFALLQLLQALDRLRPAA